MPTVLLIRRWSIIGFWCLFAPIRIQIYIVAILAVIPIDISVSEIKPLEFSRGLPSPAGGGDGIALIFSFTFIFVIATAPWLPEMQFVIQAIVVYREVWVSASDPRLLKRHFGGQIVKKNTIVNTCCFHADDHGRCWVLRLLDLTLDYSKRVFRHLLLVALW